MTENNSSHGTVARGAVILTAFQFASKPLYGVFFILLGNRALFSDEDFGRLESFLTLANVLFILADLGLESYLIRELARDTERTSRKLPGIVTLKSILTAAAVGVLVASASLFGLRGETADMIALVGAALFSIALSAQSFIRSVSRSRDRMEVEGIMAVLEKGLTLAFGGLVLWWGGGHAGVLWAIALASCVGAMYGVSKIRTFQTGLCPGWPPAISILKTSFPFALTTVCVLLFYYMDTLMLMYFGGDVWVARYARSRRVLMALLLFPQMIGIAIYPTLSRLKHDPEERARIGARFLDALFFIAIPLVAGGWAVAGPMVDVLYGASSPEALTWRWDARVGGDSTLLNATEAGALRILLLGLPFTCGNYLVGQALNSIDLQYRNFQASAVTLVINLVLNAAMIPSLGPLGAALATAVSQAVYFLGMYAFLRRTDTSWILWKRLVGLSVCALGMVCVVLWLPDWNLFVRIATGVGVYAFATRLLRLWPVERISSLVRSSSVR